MSRRVGAIDCGTNSIRLLVADLTEDNGLIEVTRQLRIVRLGEGIDAAGRIGDAAMTRTLEAAADYARTCQELGCDSVRFVATSASRDAANAQDFIAGVEQAFTRAGHAGVSPEVISGQQEAELSFAGATAGLVAEGVPGPYLVVDIGGGSTEFVRGSARVESATSVDIGCVRLTERHLHDDPPTEDQVWAALSDIVRAIDGASTTVELSGVGTLVGLAGSVTTVSAHVLGLSEYDPARIHGSTASPEAIHDAATDLLLSSASRRAELGFMHPGRVDVIGAGALIWRSVVQRVTHDSPAAVVRTSETDILDGIALSQAS